jgi:hypothetical protein
MPRGFRGLSGGSRLPLRGFTQLLKNLSAVERDRLASAFADAEDMLNFHNTTVPERQTKRRVSGLVQVPVVIADASVLGASVRWERLLDPRISFYEIQIDNNNVFANAEVFTILDTFFTLENVNNVKFVRIRGVRGDGETGNWSDPVRIQPTITAPEAFSVQFYQHFEGSDPKILKKVHYGGPGFYSLFTHRFYVDREVGNVSAWGYITNRLKNYRNSNVRPWDRVRFKVNGIARMDQYFPLWTDTFNDLDNYPQVVSGVPMSFYMKGGYTAAFGPYGVDIPATVFGQGPQDPHLFRDEEADTPSDSFYWKQPRRIHNQMKWEQGQLDDVTDLNTSQEAFFVGLPSGRKTGYLTAQDFKFNFDPEDTITGIEVLVKRRQLLPPQALIEVDDGPAIPNFPLDNTTGVSNDDITVDAAYGRHVTIDAASSSSVTDRLQVLSTGSNPIGYEGATDRLSVSLWVNNNRQITTGTKRLFQIENAAGGTIRNLFEIVLEDIGGLPSTGRRFQIVVEDKDSNLIRWRSAAGAATPITHLASTWHNVVATFSGVGGGPLPTVSLMLDGGIIAMPLDSGGTFTGFNATANRYIDIIAGNSNGSGLSGARGQVGIWNAILDSLDAASIYNAFGSADLREDFDNYDKSDNLLHYYLRLPGESDIRDFEVFLIDNNGEIQKNAVNQAVTTESWPLLAEYLTTSVADPIDGTAVATATGIPHDNMTGIGYQTYGGENNTWGFYTTEPITAEAVNSENFGVAFRARSQIHLLGPDL